MSDLRASRHLDSATETPWTLLSHLFIYISKQVPVYFSCLGERRHTVWLWSSRNVLWAMKLYPIFHQCEEMDEPLIHASCASTSVIQQHVRSQLCNHHDGPVEMTRDDSQSFSGARGNRWAAELRDAARGVSTSSSECAKLCLNLPHWSRTSQKVLHVEIY